MERNKIYLPVILILGVILFSCRKDEGQISPRAKIFNEMTAVIEDHQCGEVHSLLIAKNDTIIFEKYFNGYSREDKHQLYSVTKSFTSALIGICLEKGFIDSIGMRVLDFFPEYKNTLANYDSLKAMITIRDLLTMTPGLTWDEWTTSYNDPENDVRKLMLSNDWVKYVLDRPMIHSPGTFITYNSGVSHVLSGIITKATGQTAADFARTNLFFPLEINDWTWDSATNNISVGGWGLSLRPVDMIKFGQLYLKGGLWKNIQVIPQSWIGESIMPHYQMNNWCDYGYQWWRYGDNMASVHAKGIFFASGRGEQFIWVIPDKNTVVVCTAWNDGQSKLEHILWDYIIKALEI